MSCSWCTAVSHLWGTHLQCTSRSAHKEWIPAKHKWPTRNNEINTMWTDKFVITLWTCIHRETLRTYREYFIKFFALYRMYAHFKDFAFPNNTWTPSSNDYMYYIFSVERHWNFIHHTILLLQYCGITKSLWNEQIALKDHIYNILNLQSLLTSGARYKILLIYYCVLLQVYGKPRMPEQLWSTGT